ncbi:MAG: outer membrane beta-barrel protein [Syntrophales bacterium]|jgi:hypothetical protein|nr:outer membrane beta-barrel protein [Syntrophales bacterium]NLN59884.1 outer membrane beta-barrel protein [Deltaproteobacteria bacterium]
MRKSFFVCLVTVLLMMLAAGPVLAEGQNYLSNRVGVGYQGLLSGDYVNGISVRGWFGDNFGLEGNFFFGEVDADVRVSSMGRMGNIDADVWFIELKPMYALVVKPNSRFYVGMKFGYGEADLKVRVGDTKVKLDPDFWEIGALVGSEFSLPFMPEVAFNFDVGYNYVDTDSDIRVSGLGKVADIDLDMDGIFATWGIKYYF